MEKLKPYHDFVRDLLAAHVEIANLSAQLSLMTQERDAHGVQRDEVEKRLLDCQYKLADVTAKLAEARDEVCSTCADGTMYERATTAETALREARAVVRDCIYGRLGGQPGYVNTLAISRAERLLSAAPQTEAPPASEPTGTDDDNLSRGFVAAARALLPAPEKCPKCGGSGIDKTASWADDNLIACPACHGTGWKVQNG